MYLSMSSAICFETLTAATTVFAPVTTSPEAKYIVEIENDYQEKQSVENNSRDRILNMAEKLKKVKNGDYA